MLASVEQVLAYFLPEAPAEMLQNFDEVSHDFLENVKCYLYPPQTKFGGVYRFHPVCLSA